MDLDAGQLMLNPSIDINFGDGSYTFALKLPQIIELEEKCGYRDESGNRHKRGVVAVYSDMLAGLLVENGRIIAVPHLGRASAFDCREVIRLGLIGGGNGIVNGESVSVNGSTARELVERYVDAAPIVEAWTTAAAILRAAIEGFAPPKKAEPANEPAGEPSPSPSN